MKRSGLLLSLLLLLPSLAFASGYGVFTQGASGLGQANAVVAHPTGPSSLYFNPALLNDVPGRQVEIGTTAVYSEREIDLDSGGTEKGDSAWNFPSSFYYTHNGGERFAAGIGVFFPFGLSNEWDKDYEGRYIGTKGEMFSMNINPAVSF
jgi:long-chain fatty acid transport protein